MTRPSRLRLQIWIVVAGCAVALVWGAPALAWSTAVHDNQTGLFVIDGDTLIVNGERIRLRSEAGPIDAPERGKAKCPLELFRAEAARDRLRALMAPNDFSIDRRGKDRYGRTVGIVYSEGVDVAGRMVREGQAKPWPKLTKADRPTWCGP